eukprot:CAMPEP_0113579430 /NCGR_PEP_ID=MMETSP0015_2-20120614/30063_1 /TAXON_ID=2838 /ORGANISM="Odontella" /LENGTH=77 /DNA_ID=CAMNT_0000483407 /DNA_START=71 /DNA_END=300 /DNA_ORIENTATION=+ /assembly_acc=CAM_ASM_000160
MMILFSREITPSNAQCSIEPAPSIKASGLALAALLIEADEDCCRRCRFPTRTPDRYRPLPPEEFPALDAGRRLVVPA